MKQLLPAPSKNLFLIMTTLAVSLAATAAQPADSISTDSIAAIEKALSKNLNEVTVKGETHWHEAKGSTYLPTKKQKNASGDAIDLLARMAIPEISARFGSTDVTTQSGQPVSLFINFMPATPRELKGMRVADCARVEYLESPTDPRFQGATYVINFIMQVYEYGGYTKLSVNQQFPSMYQNNETLFSRFTYRKMTFDLSAAAYNVINNHAGTSQYAVMRLTDNDEKEFLLHRDETLGKSRMKSNYYPISFQATYISPKIQFRNTLSYAFTSYPVSERSGQLTYTPSLDKEDYTFHSDNPSRDNTLSYSGLLNVMLPRNFSLSFSPSFAYTHTNSSTAYSRSGSDIVDRHAREDAYNVRGKLFLQKMLKAKHFVSLGLHGGDDINRLRYFGTDNFNDKYSNVFFAGEVGYTFTASKIRVKVDGGCAWERSSINGVKNNDYYPYAHLTSRWAINQRNNLSLFLQYATNSTDIASRASDILVVNDVMLKTGNPDLKNSRHTTLNLSYFHIFSDNVYLTANGTFFSLFDRPAEEYAPYDGGQRIIRRLTNSGDFYNTTINATLNVYLFNKRLALNLTPAIALYKTTGIGASDLTNPYFNFMAQYYFGNFSLTGSVTSPKKAFAMNNGEIYTPIWSYNLMLTWGHGDWNIGLYATNFFNTRYRCGTAVMDSPYYSYTNVKYNGYNARATFTVQVSYTFGYGKKVSRGNENLDFEKAKSAIM